MSKADKKAAAAARARALLGLDDESKPDDRVAQRAGALPADKPVLDAGRGDDSKPGPKPSAARKGTRAPVPGRVLQPGPGSSERGALPEELAASFSGDFKFTQIDPKHYPKKHEPGALKRGDSVWYRGERYWVEFAPTSWDKGCYARITDARIKPDVDGVRQPGGTDLAYMGDDKKPRSANIISFCVHPDMLDLAPQAKSLYASQPSMADVARKERTAKGERDVGDPVAVRLRDARDLEHVYEIGAEFLGEPVEALKAKYGHLNPGQQRMNIGNRMRAKWRKDQK